MNKLIKVLAGLVVVVLLVVIAAVYFSDRWLKVAVETLGPEITGTPVTLSSARLSLKSGEGSLNGLVVGNPEGFTTPSALSLGEISLAVDTGTVTDDPVVINSLRIIAPEINLESAGSSTNLKQLQRNIERATGSGGSSSGGSSDEGVRLVIRDLLISGGKVSYTNPLLEQESVALELPEIHLTGIGEKSNGVTAAELARQLLARINREAISQVSKSGVLKDVEGQLREKVEQERGKVGGFLEGLKGAIDREEETQEQ